MSEPRDYQATLTAAEQAASSGDFEAADTLLRETARLQEAALGPLHPDLANTLNNLGIVAEQTGKTRDAEGFYRRAFAIAGASLPADHPFVATSRQNLEEFCKARGLSLDVPVVLTPSAHDAVKGLELFPHEPADDAPAVPASAAPAAASVDVAPMTVAKPQPSKPQPPAAPPLPKAKTPVAPVRRRDPVVVPPLAQKAPTAPVNRPVSSRSPIAILLGVAALVVFGLLLTQPWSASEPPATPAEPTSSGPPAAANTPGPATEPAPAPPPAAPPPREPTPAAPVTQAPSSAGKSLPAAMATPPATPPSPAAPAGSAASSSVDARLCQNFSTSTPGTWRCDPAGESVEPGRLVMLTRVRSPRDTTVVHRWFLADALRQSVRLQVGANPTGGYRTYSRQTVTAGAWRVEVRSADGALLYEQRITVQ